MSIKTQGTKLFAIDPDDGSLIGVDCAVSISGIDSTNEQIETTCLEADVRTYIAGLSTPGQASYSIRFDPSNANHVRLHQLKLAGTTLEWALGWSDGTQDPAIVQDSNALYVFDAPNTRTWIEFDGFMTSFPFDFQQNAIVESSVSIQISGEPVLIPKT